MNSAIFSKPAFLLCLLVSVASVFAQQPAATNLPPASAPASAPSPAQPGAAAPSPPTTVLPAQPAPVTAPAVPAIPPAPSPSATPAVTVPQASQGSSFDERFTAFTEESMPQPMVRFKYRIWPHASVTDTKVEANGQPLAADDFRAVPYSSNPLNETALLILVDTSVGSSRQPRNSAIDATKMAIAQIVNQTQPRTLVGLYTFANDLTELAPVGSTPDLIKRKLMDMKADGLGTRLYRRSMDAIEKLVAVDAQRKALLIFSDGKDEDSGYNKNDLQAAADKAGVIVMALGCPETEQDVPALGALEAVAQQTKGLYAQLPVVLTSRKQVLATFPGSVLQSLDGGGDVAASLKNVPPGAAITVKLTTSSGQVLEKALQLAAPLAPSPTPEPQASPVPTPTPPSLSFWEKIGAYLMAPQHRIWVILGGIVLLLVGIGLLVLLLKLFKSSPPPPPMPVMPMDETSFSSATTLLDSGARGAALAYLVVQDANATKMPLNKTATRIGRRSDNDLIFSNSSISGHHAEIHISRDGAFSITDLGSGNGVFVNGERVHQCGLRDGDIIELGEVRFRFSL